MVAAHGDGVHDELAALVLGRGAVRQVVGVVFCSEVVAQLMGGDQVGFLDTTVLPPLPWRHQQVSTRHLLRRTLTLVRMVFP